MAAIEYPQIGSIADKDTGKENFVTANGSVVNSYGLGFGAAVISWDHSIEGTDNTLVPVFDYATKTVTVGATVINVTPA